MAFKAMFSVEMYSGELLDSKFFKSYTIETFFDRTTDQVLYGPTIDQAEVLTHLHEVGFLDLENDTLRLIPGSDLSKGVPYPEIKFGVEQVSSKAVVCEVTLKSDEVVIDFMDTTTLHIRITVHRTAGPTLIRSLKDKYGPVRLYRSGV